MITDIKELQSIPAGGTVEVNIKRGSHIVKGMVRVEEVIEDMHNYCNECAFSMGCGGSQICYKGMRTDKKEVYFKLV